MPDSSSVQSLDPLTRSQRLLGGCLLLLLVDIIWVASSEFTEFIFKDLKYEKPYFSTYLKTSLFTTYLIGFLVYQPWRDECRQHSRGRTTRDTINGQYQRVQIESEEENFSESDSQPSTSNNGSLFRSLSSPLMVPANIPESHSGKSSGTEETESDVDGASSSSRRKQRVRFRQMAEVVEMQGDAIAASISRMSYSATLRAQAALRRAAQRLTLFEVAKLALIFCFPWFIGNYCYQEALSKTEAAVVNILSSSSSFFTLILSALFPSDSGDKLSLSKSFAVVFSICGVIIVCYSDLHIEGDASVPKGAIWALCGSIFYSIYIVLLRRKVNNEENMDAPMFFGFVGLFNAALLWPGLIFCHFTGNETFEMPTIKQWEFLIINGFIGTVLSELLWLLGCFYTSSLLGTLAIGLTIPLSIIADIFWRDRHYETIFVIGVVPMFLSFFVIAMLTHYEDYDPLLDFCKMVWYRLKALICCRRQSSPADRHFVERLLQTVDRQERESLINNQDHDIQSTSHENPLS